MQTANFASIHVGAGSGFGSTNKGTSKDYWAKGTGFGFGSTTSTQFNLADHMSNKKQNEVVFAHLLNAITSFIKPTSSESDSVSPLSIPPVFVEMIKNSCLSATISSYLLNDSG